MENKEVKGFLLYNPNDEIGPMLYCSKCYVITKLDGRLQDFNIVRKYDQEVMCELCGPKDEADARDQFIRWTWHR